MEAGDTAAAGSSVTAGDVAWRDFPKPGMLQVRETNNNIEATTNQNSGQRPDEIVPPVLSFFMTLSYHYLFQRWERFNEQRKIYRFHYCTGITNFQ